METIKSKLNNFITWWNCKNYLDAIRVFHFFGVLIGFPVFLFNQNTTLNNKNPLIRFFNQYIMLILWELLYCYLVIANLTENNFLTLSTSQIVNSGRRFALIAASLNVIFGLLALHYLRNRCDQILQEIIHFDTNVKKLNTEVNHQIEFKYITIYEALNLLESILFIYFAATYLDKCITLKLCILMHLPIYAIAIIHVQFYNHMIIFGMSIVYRFKLINQHLWRFCKINEEFHKKHIFNYKDNKISPIMIFAQLHDKLNDSVEHINACYAVPLMISTAAVFAFLVVTIFAVFRTFFYQDTELGVMTKSFVLWCTYYVIHAIVIIIVGSKITYEAKTTAVVVHKLLNTSRDAKLRYELKKFSKQLIHRVPKISCGLFTFDWTLMYSIISAITTYLVILIQFDASMAPSDNSTTSTT